MATREGLALTLPPPPSPHPAVPSPATTPWQASSSAPRPHERKFGQIYWDSGRLDGSGILVFSES